MWRDALSLTECEIGIEWSNVLFCFLEENTKDFYNNGGRNERRKTEIVSVSKR